MNFKKIKYIIYTDYYRINKHITIWKFVKDIIFNEGFKYIFWMRACKYLRDSKFYKYPFYYFAKGILRRYMYKYGISIPFTTQIGNGLYIGHFGGIIINPNSKIGNNCNLSQNITLGQKNRGNLIGAPIIGDNVYIAPGVKIIGKIKIGNNCAIGANCVVTKDVPNNSVVVGIPGKVISNNGAEGYINRTDYKSYNEFYS